MAEGAGMLSSEGFLQRRCQGSLLRIHRKHPDPRDQLQGQPVSAEQVDAGKQSNRSGKSCLQSGRQLVPTPKLGKLLKRRLIVRKTSILQCVKKVAASLHLPNRPLPTPGLLKDGQVKSHDEPDPSLVDTLAEWDRSDPSLIVARPLFHPAAHPGERLAVGRQGQEEVLHPIAAGHRAGPGEGFEAGATAVTAHPAGTHAAEGQC